MNQQWGEARLQAIAELADQMGAADLALDARSANSSRARAAVELGAMQLGGAEVEEWLDRRTWILCEERVRTG